MLKPEREANTVDRVIKPHRVVTLRPEQMQELELRGQTGFQGQGEDPRQADSKERNPFSYGLCVRIHVHRVRVTTGAADATNTEIKSGIKEGDEVILSMTAVTKATAATSETTTSPFMPQRRPQPAPVRR